MKNLLFLSVLSVLLFSLASCAIGGNLYKDVYLLLCDENTAVKGNAADSLAKTKNAQAVKPLCIALLNDPDPDVRVKCAKALGELGFEQAINSLQMSAEKDASIDVKESATTAIEKISSTAEKNKPKSK